MPPTKYKMPEPLAKNEVLIDLLKQKWVLGPSIGKGGFGEIYSAASGEAPPSKESDYCYALKVEPFDNGPLYVERMFYMRAAKKDTVNSWMQNRKLKTFGMPIMHGHGSHQTKNARYRFLVMDRFSRDLETLLKKCNNSFPDATVLKVSTQILDVLEYIHSQGYIHADIKAGNILLGGTKQTENQVFLVDFGIAGRFCATKDPKKRDNGTLQLLSRDAHEGGITRRGDLEILAYNIILWLSSKLPWDLDASKKNIAAVRKAKEVAMTDIPKFLKACFGKKEVPDFVSKYVVYVSKLEYEEAPDYAKVRQIFLDGLKKLGVKLESPLVFSKPLEQHNGEPKKTRTSPRKAAKRTSSEAQISTSISEIENEDSSCDSSEQKPLKSKRRKVTSKPKAKPTEKASWRDCPTAKASGVVRAGEYISKKQK